MKKWIALGAILLLLILGRAAFYVWMAGVLERPPTPQQTAAFASEARLIADGSEDTTLTFEAIDVVFGPGVSWIPFLEPHGYQYASKFRIGETSATVVALDPVNSEAMRGVWELMSWDRSKAAVVAAFSAASGQPALDAWHDETTDVKAPPGGSVWTVLGFDPGNPDHNFIGDSAEVVESQNGSATVVRIERRSDRP